MTMNIIAIVIYAAICLTGIGISWWNWSDFRGALTEKSADGSTNQTSFSRLVGAAGAFMLTGFLMIFGGFVIWNFGEKQGATDIKTWFEALQGFLWTSVALFAPYAANQLSRVLPGQAAAPGAAEAPNQPAEVRMPPRAPSYDPNR